jgi:hypothetical protein
MVPDVAPDDGVQPELQFDPPPHVRVAAVFVSSQLVQIVEAVAAVYLPASQFVQTVDAIAAEYLPATQSVHTEAPAAEYLPATQYQQCAFEVAPVTAEYLPASQLLHAGGSVKSRPSFSASAIRVHFSSLAYSSVT